MLLFYIRHGDPIYDPDSLTPLGHRQAEAVAHRLAVYGLDEIYSSTSQRARMTAQPTCELLQKEPTLLDWCEEGVAASYYYLHEGDSPFWVSGNQEYRKQFCSPEVRALGDRWYEHPAFAGRRFKEGVEFFQQRTDAFLAGQGYVHDRENRVYRITEPNNKRIAVFAHYGVSMSFFSSILDIPYPLFCSHFDITHTGMTVVEFENDPGGICIPRVLTLSNDSHLYKAGLPCRYNRYLPI